MRSMVRAKGEFQLPTLFRNLWRHASLRKSRDVSSSPFPAPPEKKHLSPIMPHLSWNEVRDRAIRFSRDPANANARSERSEKQTFWNSFFDVFGLRRASLASFEENVVNLKGNTSCLSTNTSPPRCSPPARAPAPSGREPPPQPRPAAADAPRACRKLQHPKPVHLKKITLASPRKCPTPPFSLFPT